MTVGLMGRIGKRGDRHDWESRDYALSVIPCENTLCPVNRAKKCTASAAIEIGANGRCLTGAAFKDKPAVKPTREVCAICGGRIRWTGQTWVHVDEKFRHPATARD
jgi:hypothetical protein